MIFFLLFVVLPFVELALLLQIGSEIGAGNTIALIIATGLLGGYLAKHEGLSVWIRFQNKLAQGGMPGDELLDGLIILVSGALLVTPGVITDVVGFLGLLPLTRHFFKSQIKKRLVIDGSARVRATFWTWRPGAAGPGRAVDRESDRPSDRDRVGETSQSQSEQKGVRPERVDITEIVNRHSQTD